MTLHILRTCVLGSLVILAGCNTVEGFGQDVQKGGENLERSARQYRHLG